MNKARKIVSVLQELYPEAKCELNYRTPYELLIATMLSAQSTDKRVNIITKDLFASYNTPDKMVPLSEGELIELIRTIGFYNNKAKNILMTSHILLEKYGGEVPKTREELVKLPGVGRKTANVVISNAFGIPAFAVDTHVGRVTNRLGLTKSKNPNQIEIDVTSQLPKKLYTQAHHLFIFHGRKCCKAIRPLCDSCPLTVNCTYYKQNKQER